MVGHGTILQDEATIHGRGSRETAIAAHARSERARTWEGAERRSEFCSRLNQFECVPGFSLACAEYAGSVPAQRLNSLFKELAPSGKFSHTFGCLDPVQVVQMSPYLSTIYVSGWQSSSTASTTNEPGPDLADYPYTTVPNKVQPTHTPPPPPPPPPPSPPACHACSQSLRCFLCLLFFL